MPEIISIIYKLYLLGKYNKNKNKKIINLSSKLAPLVPELTSHWAVFENSFIINSYSLFGGHDKAYFSPQKSYKCF